MRRREKVPNLYLKSFGFSSLLAASAYGFIAYSDNGYQPIDTKVLYTIDPDPRQLVAQRLSSQPRGAFELITETKTDGQPLTLLAYKGPETFYSEREKDSLGRPARKVCSDIFLYHARLDQAQKPGQVSVSYTATGGTSDAQHWQTPNSQNRLFVPDTMVHNDAVLRPLVVTHTSVCRLELFQG